MYCFQFLHHLGALLPVQRSITLQLQICMQISPLFCERACSSREREAPSLEIHDTVSLSIRLHNEKTAKLQPVLCIPAVVTMFSRNLAQIAEALYIVINDGAVVNCRIDQS
jgi:hypothetical protein